MHTVAQVLEPGFRRSWHEAVAIVQEVASQLGPGVNLPDPMDVAFEEDGSLTFGFAGESDVPPVSGLGRLLQDLLAGIEAPNGLRELADENAVVPPAHAHVASLVKALSFYERPGRANDVAAVAGRVRELASYERSDVEVERLREKLAAPKDEEPAVVAAPAGPRPRRRLLALVACLEVVVLLLIFRYYTRPADASSPRVAERTDERPAGAFETGLPGPVPPRIPMPGAQAPAASPVALGTSAVPMHVGQPVPAGRVPGSARAVPRYPAVSAAAPTGSAAPAPSDVAPVQNRPSPPAGNMSGAAASASSAVPLRAEVTDASSRGDGSDERIYSAADTQVRPAVLLRPQIPRQPVAGADTGYLELLINQAGLVEAVRLVSPTDRYHDKMLVAAAKAWKFSPATLMGRPVRFVTRVAINIDGPR